MWDYCSCAGKKKSETKNMPHDSAESKQSLSISDDDIQK